MAGGTLSIVVPNYPMLTQVAQRVSCWAGGVGGIRNRFVNVSSLGTMKIVVQEEIFAAGGPLILEPGGSDLLAGYVAGTHISFTAGNGTAAHQNPNTCAADNAQAPVINSVATNVGSDPLAITIDYANFAGNGTVNVTWGDGTVTNGAAESNAALAHTYPYQPGIFVIRVADASVPAVFTETTISIP